MPHAVVLIPGDGFGPEVTEATWRIPGAAGADLAWRPRHPRVRRRGDREAGMNRESSLEG